MKIRSPRNAFARRLAVTSAALLGTALTPLPALAQDATWNGPGNVWGTGANWNPAAVPTNRATFSANAQTNIVNNSATTINQIVFDTNAPSYAITNTNAGTFTVNGIAGVGIDNQSGVTQRIFNSGVMTFNNASVVGGQVNISNFGEGAGSTLTFNGTTALSNGILASQGEAAAALGMATNTTGTAATTFNDTSSADDISIAVLGGNASGLGAGGMSTQAIASGASLTFNDASHADDGAINLFSGLSLATGGPGVGEIAVTLSGGASVLFNDTSHADRTAISLSAGFALATGGTGGSGIMNPGSGAQASSGAVTAVFTGDSHADNAGFFIGGGNSVATGGTGGAGTAVEGGEGGNSGGVTGPVVLAFVDNSHADGATITAQVGSTGGIGGSGGDGGAANGGDGGSGFASNGGVVVQFAGTSHANGATISMGSGATQAVGGSGGNATGAGNGGAGGAGTAQPGVAVLSLSGSATVAGSTITNTAGSALAQGGLGGDGGAGTGTGGAGGTATANGALAVVTIQDNATLGAGTTLINQGGSANATGGSGGNGGSGASAGGAGGSAQAVGGLAILSFSGNASAGNATITNSAGSATALSGNGGNGDVGNGGNAGTASAVGGDAAITFSGSSTAGSATIQNLQNGVLDLDLGDTGTDGAGGGIGGSFVPASGQVGQATISFANNATGGSAKIQNVGGDVTFTDSSIFGTAAGAQIANTNSGLVAFNGSSSLGSGTVTTTGLATNVEFNDSSSAGTGAIVNNGGGVLFNDSATAGSAIINNNSGPMAFSGNSLAGTAVITNGGQLSFLDSTDAVAARVINTASGIVTINVNAFRLGSLSGTGSVNVGANTVQIGYLDLNETFAGVVAGTGSLIKRGTGTFVLTGQNTYTGDTTVLAGTLQVDGRITSNTGVAAGTTLSGVGTIAGTVGNFGTIRAGNAANPLGTLTVTGTAIFNNGSILAPTITSAGQTSLLQAGLLTINAGTVRPTAAPGGLFLMQSDYRIAVGTGGRTGTFGGVDESLLPTFLDASLFYTPTEVFLRVRRNATTFAQTVGLTPNQSAVSTSLDAAVAANNPLVFTTYLSTYNALLALPASALPGALNVLSGDALTAVPVAAQEHGNRFAERLGAYTWSNSSNIWGLIAYGDQDADGDGNGPGFAAKGLEFQVGFNTSLGANTRLGLSAGYNDGDVDNSDRLATADIETWSLGAHLRHDFGPIYVSGQLTYSWHSIESNRTLLIAGSANAGYDATTWTAAGEIGWVAQSGSLAIEPHLSIRHASTDQDAYSETGPAGALNVAAAEYETTRFGIGVRLANRNPQAAVRFHALVRYEHEAGDERSVLDNTLPGLPTFRVFGTRLGDDILTGEIGAEFRLSQGLSLFASAGGHTRSNETSLNANAGLRIAF